MRAGDGAQTARRRGAPDTVFTASCGGAPHRRAASVGLVAHSDERAALLSRSPARAQRALAEMVTGIFSAWASDGGARPGGAPAPVYECAMSIGWCAAREALATNAQCVKS